MAKKNQEEAPAGSPAWMATFSDLMNLLLCFFVLLFSMCSVDAEKFQMVLASIQSSFSVLNGGTDTIGDGDLVGAGVSMLSDYDIYLNELANSNGSSYTESNGGDTDNFGASTNDQQASDNGSDTQNADLQNPSDSSEGQSTDVMDQSGKPTDQNSTDSQENPANADADNAGSPSNADAQNTQDQSGGSPTNEQIEEQFKEMSASETEEMAKKVESMAEELGIANLIDVSFTADYVVVNLKGALLFDSASADLKEGSTDLLDKIGIILENYSGHVVDVVGHTDNVPMNTGEFANNRVLSVFRAMSVADYFLDTTGLDPTLVSYTGRGEYDPVADNSTAEGRALNRRVEIRLYNSYNS